MIFILVVVFAFVVAGMAETFVAVQADSDGVIATGDWADAPRAHHTLVLVDEQTIGFVDFGLKKAFRAEMVARHLSFKIIFY